MERKIEKRFLPKRARSPATLGKFSRELPLGGAPLKSPAPAGVALRTFASKSGAMCPSVVRTKNSKMGRAGCKKGGLTSFQTKTTPLYKILPRRDQDRRLRLLLAQTTGRVHWAYQLASAPPRPGFPFCVCGHGLRTRLDYPAKGGCYVGPPRHV